MIGGGLLVLSARTLWMTHLGPRSNDPSRAHRNWGSIGILAIATAVVLAGLLWTIEGDRHGSEPRASLAEIALGVLQWLLFLIVLCQWILSAFPPGPKAWLDERRGMLKLSGAYATSLIVVIATFALIVRHDLGAGIISRAGLSWPAFKRAGLAILGTPGGPFHSALVLQIGAGALITLVGVVIGNRWARIYS